MMVKIKQNLPDHQKVSLLIIPVDLDSELCMNWSYFFNGDFYSEGNTNYNTSLLFKSAFPFTLQSWVINLNTIAGGQHKRMNRIFIFHDANILPPTMDDTTCDVLYHLMASDNLMIWNRQGQKIWSFISITYARTFLFVLKMVEWKI